MTYQPLQSEDATLKTANLGKDEARMSDTELRELCKLSWRAMCDAEAVVRTIDPESATEGERLRELSARLADCAMHLFIALRESPQEWAKATSGVRAAASLSDQVGRTQ